MTHPGITGHYLGVCDEYAILFTSMARIIGIPTNFLTIQWNDWLGRPKAHAIAEVFDGSSWIHCDPTWRSFNDPQIYKRNEGATDIWVEVCLHAYDDFWGGDPERDGWLYGDYDMYLLWGDPYGYYDPYQ